MQVNKFVRGRALKNRNCAVPVRCEAVKESGKSRRGCGPDDVQQTVGKCVRDHDPKEFYGLGFVQALKFEGPVATPVKFFCLPFF